MANPVIKECKEIGLTALLHDNGLQLFSEHSGYEYHTPSEWATNDVDLALANWAGQALAMRAASRTSPASKTLGLSQDDLLTLAHLDPQGRSLQHKAVAIHVGPRDCYDGRAVFIGAAVVIFLVLLWQFYPHWSLWWLLAALVILSLLGLILTAIFNTVRAALAWPPGQANNGGAPGARRR